MCLHEKIIMHAPTHIWGSDKHNSFLGGIFQVKQRVLLSCAIRKVKATFIKGEEEKYRVW